MTSEEHLEILRHASEFTAFHEKLSIIINPLLDKTWTLADFGCGIALLDFYLAPNVSSISAIDIDESVLVEVDKMIDEELYKGNEDAGKIKTLKADTSELSDDMKWDAVLLNFYNVPFDELDYLISRANKRAFIIVDGKSSNSKFHPSSLNRNSYTAPELNKYFISKGYNFKKEIVEMQFGYPFKNLPSIYNFLSKYYDKEHLEEMDFENNGSLDSDKLFASAEERIIKTNRFDYPYYLPKSVSIGVFVIEC